MAKFKVRLEVTDIFDFIVDAESHDDAEQKVGVLYENDDFTGAELKDTMTEVYRVWEIGVDDEND